MAFRRSEYPPEWKAIRQRILARAGNQCEGCIHYPDCRAANHQPHPVTGSRVVLTISHWPDCDPMNCADDNLAARCQRCHLSIDRPHHLRKQKEKRVRKAMRRQPPLPFSLDEHEV